MSAFSKTRNVELSTLFYLETQIGANWTGIEIVKSFLSAYDKVLPVVCIRLTDVITDRLEVGSTTLDNLYTFVIDIFATSDGQRIDLGDFIMEQLKSGWIYYSYSKASGSSTLDKIATSRVTVTEFVNNSRIDFGDEVSNPDRFRQTITFNTRIP